MKITKVKEGVGFDGETYFCMRCGKAGFKSPAAVVGHLAHCQGIAHLATTILARSAPGLITTIGAGAAAQQQRSTINSETTLPAAGAQQQPSMINTGIAFSAEQRIWAVIDQFDKRISRLEQVCYNETPHLVAAQQQKPEWKEKLLLIGIGFFLGWFLRGEYEPRGPGSGRTLSVVSKVGERALTKAVDKAIGALLP